MIDYILEKIKADGAHLISLSKNEEKIQHAGLRGRFRELLIDNMLNPWLPPYVATGTGMIIADGNQKRQFTQDDIILFDKSLAPPILASQSGFEGVFLFNSVLARIEVKSTVKKENLKAFCKSSSELSQLKFSVYPNFKENYYSPFNLFFGYKSDADVDNKEEHFELRRLVEVMKEGGLDPLGGIVSMICILGKGFWKIGFKPDKITKTWQKLNPSDAEDQIAWFIGAVSNTCYHYHLIRQGRDPLKSLESGIGVYLDHPFSDVDISNF